MGFLGNLDQEEQVVQRDSTLITHRPCSLPAAGRLTPGLPESVPCSVPGSEEEEAVESWTESSQEYGGGSGHFYRVSQQSLL